MVPKPAIRVEYVQKCLIGKGKCSSEDSFAFIAKNCATQNLEIEAQGVEKYQQSRELFSSVRLHARGNGNQDFVREKPECRSAIRRIVISRELLSYSDAAELHCCPAHITQKSGNKRRPTRDRSLMIYPIISTGSMKKQVFNKQSRCLVVSCELWRAGWIVKGDCWRAGWIVKGECWRSSLLRYRGTLKTAQLNGL